MCYSLQLSYSCCVHWFPWMCCLVVTIGHDIRFYFWAEILTIMIYFHLFVYPYNNVFEEWLCGPFLMLAHRLVSGTGGGRTDVNWCYLGPLDISWFRYNYLLLSGAFYLLHYWRASVLVHLPSDLVQYGNYFMCADNPDIFVSDIMRSIIAWTIKYDLLFSIR